MREISSPNWLYVKATLFLILGVTSGALLVLGDAARLRTLTLLALSVWSFSRFYYFCFYVLERYVDSSFRFSGLFSAVAHVLRAKGKTHPGSGVLPPAPR
ncbi:MAG TPA: hypothetical protein VKB93_14490 [Thermoanaerobaculia bacterium]|nr:hypothetical protein [Thermoanaerobaculia bacterium]